MILKVFGRVADFLTNSLPEGVLLPVDVIAGIATFIGYANDFDFIVPTGTIFIALAVIVNFEILIISIRIFKFILRHAIHLVPFT